MHQRQRNPASVFPIADQTFTIHVKKLSEGSQIFYAKLVGEIMNMLTNEFPRTLSLADQGRFMIGYYQQVQAFYTKAESNQ